MKQYRFYVLSLALVSLFFSSCGLFTNKNLSRRFRNTSNDMFQNASDPQSFVQVELNSVLLRDVQPPQVTYNLLSLSERGQAQFIQAASAKTDSSKAFLEVLTNNFSFSKEAPPNIKIISKNVKKSLVFTVNRNYYVARNNTTTFNLMGDRVAFLELLVAIPAASKLTFNNWDKYVTDHLTLNLGKVTSAQQWNASLNLNAKGVSEVTVVGANANEDFTSGKETQTITIVNSGEGPSGLSTGANELLNTGKGTTSSSNSVKTGAELGGSGSLAFQDRFETALDLSSRIVKLSGTLSDKQLVLRQESGPSIDLSGNIVVSVEYTMDDDWATPAQYIKFKDLYKDNVPLKLAQLKPTKFIVLFPDVKGDVVGKLDYNFLYRQVQKGNRHIPEARQKVKFWYGNVVNDSNDHIQSFGGAQQKGVVLLKKEDLRPKVYRLKLNNNTLSLNGDPLEFETVAEVLKFYGYIGALLQIGESISELKLNNLPIQSSDYRQLKVISETL